MEERFKFFFGRSGQLFRERKRGRELAETHLHPNAAILALNKISES